MEIENLIALPESKTLEFKRDLSSLSPVLHTITAFANTSGGILIVGIDSGGKLIGIEDIFKQEEKLASAIADNIQPPLLPEIEIATVRGKNLLVVKVAHAKGPFYLKNLSIPRGVYVRLGSTSRPAGPELLAELQRSLAHLSYDQQPLPELSINSLNIGLAERLFKKTLDEKKLRSLGVLIPHNSRLVPSIGGLILFGNQEDREQFVPDAKIRCARFQGADKALIIDRYEEEGTILDAIESVPKFIARNSRLSAEIKGFYRRDIPEYEPVAMREVLINALAHCDYSLKGTTIQIAIFSDRLEIQNPGMLPFGFTLDDLKAGVSKVRNRVIARVFSELGLMEEWGSGYKRVMEACNQGGYGEPEWRELGSAIRVTFHSHELTKLREPIPQFLSESPGDLYSVPHPYLREYGLREPEAAYIPRLIPRHTQLLNLFTVGDFLTFREIEGKLTAPMAERTLRYDLAYLRDLGHLVPVGKGRATIWQRIK